MLAEILALLGAFSFFILCLQVSYIFSDSFS
jgi:hypothetical protein